MKGWFAKLIVVLSILLIGVYSLIWIFTPTATRFYSSELLKLTLNQNHLVLSDASSIRYNPFLSHLTISDLPLVNTIYLFDNGLKTLILTNLINLEVFKANNNKIEHFTYINTPKLERVYIFNNQLETIDIYNLPRLHYMDCRQNPMPDSLYDEMDKIDDITFLHDGNAEDW